MVRAQPVAAQKADEVLTYKSPINQCHYYGLAEMKLWPNTLV